MQNHFVFKSTLLDDKVIKNTINKKIYNNFLLKENKNFLKKNIIKKPWGFEYLFCSSKHFALWVLCIKKKKSTSLHCHLKKKTYLINSNSFILKTLNRKNKIKKFSICSLDKKFFHKSINSQNKSLTLFEFEIPNQKHDILRFSDDYNRPAINYEKKIDKSVFATNFKLNNLNNILNLNFSLINKSKSLKDGIYFVTKGKFSINGKSLKKFIPIKLNFFKNKKYKFFASKDVQIVLIVSNV
jgi:hypothetical protein